VSRHLKTNRPVHVGFIDNRRREVAANDVATIPTSAYPTDSTPTKVTAAANREQLSYQGLVAGRV
jgi:hypothetical protein